MLHVNVGQLWTYNPFTTFLAFFYIKLIEKPFRMSKNNQGKIEEEKNRREIREVKEEESET